MRQDAPQDPDARTVGPAVAGLWYPSDPVELARVVDEQLAVAAATPRPQNDARVIALIEPHAGYSYSGAVAAHGFRAVAGRKFRRVIVIGPSHHVAFTGAALPGVQAYRTPLGSMPIDVAACDELCARPGFRAASRFFAREHSLEAELPFLQRVLEPGFTLVPVLTGTGTTGPAAQEIADGLARLVGPGDLVVVSSDFTHFGPAFGFVPFREEIPGRIRTLDLGAIARIEGWDAAGFEAYVTRTGATICGRDAIEVLLRMFPRGLRAELAAYDSSGRMTGDWSHTVSYAAIVVRERHGAS